MENELIIEVTKELVYSNEVDDLGFMLASEMSTEVEREVYDDIELAITDKGYGATDTPVIKIETMEKMITEAKAKGSTHIAIEDHCDHIGYMVDGFIITRMSKDESEKLRKEKEEKDAVFKKQEIARLEERLAKLKE